MADRVVALLCYEFVDVLPSEFAAARTSEGVASVSLRLHNPGKQRQALARTPTPAETGRGLAAGIPGADTAACPASGRAPSRPSSAQPQGQRTHPRPTVSCHGTAVATPSCDLRACSRPLLGGGYLRLDRREGRSRGALGKPIKFVSKARLVTKFHPEHLQFHPRSRLIPSDVFAWTQLFFPLSAPSLPNCLRSIFFFPMTLREGPCCSRA